MASHVQNLANQANAQQSTGPTSREGKAKSSLNATTHGLFSKLDPAAIVQDPEFLEIQQSIYAETTPVGLLQLTLADQIIRAMFRLRHCDRIEDQILMATDLSGVDDEEVCRLQRSVDRARMQYQRTLFKATAELRKLQTLVVYQAACNLPPQNNLADTMKVDQAVNMLNSAEERQNKPIRPTYADLDAQDALALRQFAPEMQKQKEQYIAEMRAKGLWRDA